MLNNIKVDDKNFVDIYTFCDVCMCTTTYIIDKIAISVKVWGCTMKTKVNYKKYGTFPDMDTVKEIIIYGAKTEKIKNSLYSTTLITRLKQKHLIRAFMIQLDWVSIFIKSE